jgi:glutamine synthetase
MAGPNGAPQAPMSLTRLRELIDLGHVDTVLVVFTDMQGRLQGKRVHARFFLNDTLEHGTEACNYLLAVDIEMNTVSGYAISSWDKGYGDFMLRPDLGTLRAVPWMPNTAMVQCDVLWLDGTPVPESPRQILQRQVDRAADLGFTALAGTELEFMVFEDSYEVAFDARYQGLEKSNRYNVDYSILGTSRVETLLRDLRNAMFAAGLTVESAKGECNPGQHEIAFKYDEALITADQHCVYKTAAKEIASRHGKALTFMSKFDEREGNSCHIHMSLRGLDDAIVFGDELDDQGRSATFRHFVAGVLHTINDFTLFYAPNINSYKRFQPGSFAPTAIAWGDDNRTCALRVVGHGPSLRVENRIPGGDVNPYLALAAMLAGGLYGITHEIPLPHAFVGNAYDSSGMHVATTLRAARQSFDAPLTREVFGDDVVNHYLNMADVELNAFDAAVTDWERIRGFERM